MEDRGFNHLLVESQKDQIEHDPITLPKRRPTYAEVVIGFTDQLPPLSLSRTFSDIYRLSFNSSVSSLSPAAAAAASILFVTDYFEVKKSPMKGYGAFATKSIHRDTLILVEKAFIKAQLKTISREYEQLSSEQQQNYLSLCGGQGIGQRVTAIFKTNRFEITSLTGGIFLKSSRFNHACHPFSTCSYIYNRTLDALEIRAIKDIKKGQEMTISYTSVPSILPYNYGFECDCPACPGPEDHRSA